MQLPPKNISADQLFRDLLQLPYPTRKIQFQLEDKIITVKAISGSNLTENLNNIVKLLTITCQGHEAFQDEDILSEYLMAPELKRLSEQVFEALGIISPCYGYINHQAWSKVLEQGCQQPSNAIVSQMLGQCYDLSGGMTARLIERPDRYFGVPFNQLLDCHLLAYRAARRVYETAISQQK